MNDDEHLRKMDAELAAFEHRLDAEQAEFEHRLDAEQAEFERRLEASQAEGERFWRALLEGDDNSLAKTIRTSLNRLRALFKRQN